ncbi:GvpL/GvpF family gas vesicle protein [Mycobacterium colombiense]|uniref:Gas vesicle protein GvpFL n=1 Tax=Mycobacterium colombiense TaxID=339268 RepID=A0A1A2YVI8_9MYCO|nr:GvpL/GvpF family gas vesicle protein [Mycobacterium colombiense]OBI42015.1 gas vesicle protein GvpFL [Mycobacterium colombiense]
MSTEGVWAYAVVRAETAEQGFAGFHGVAGEPVRAVRGTGLTAVVGTVGLGEFGEEPLRRNLEDLDWLAATARAHDAVISAIARRGPVVPMRMATVFLDDNRVRELLEARRDEFVAGLDRVTSREELGVKAYADAKVLTGENEPGDRPGEKLSGTAYLMRRRRALASQDDAFRLAAEHAGRIHAGLLKHAVDGKRRPASDHRLSGREGWTVLNGTYLVERGEVDAFRAAVAAMDRNTPGIELEITGPWPPYSFAGDVGGYA